MPMDDYALVYRIDRRDVENKEREHADGVERGIAAHEVIEDIVRRAVTPHQEHIVIVENEIGNIGSWEALNNHMWPEEPIQAG